MIGFLFGSDIPLFLTQLRENWNRSHVPGIRLYLTVYRVAKRVLLACVILVVYLCLIVG